MFVQPGYIQAKFQQVGNISNSSHSIFVSAIISKMRLSIGFVIVVAVIAVGVMPAGIALGQAANPSRVLPGTVQRGQTFDVTVNFTAPADNFNGISLRDTAPDGWNVTVNEIWCDPYPDGAKVDGGNQAQLIWIGPYNNGTNFTALYKVTVPRGATLGNHNFTFTYPNYTLIYHIAGSSKIAEDIMGDSEVEVVVPTMPIISFSSASFSSSAIQGGSNPENKTLEVWNSGIDTLNWTLSDDAAWLSENPTSGSSTSADDKTLVTVSVNTAGMSVGDYSASITITAPGASNTPQTVSVSLHMGGAGPPPSPIQAWLSQYWWTIVAGIVVVVLLVYFLRRRRGV
jgi:hypothetical protein